MTDESQRENDRVVQVYSVDTVSALVESPMLRSLVMEIIANSKGQIVIPHQVRKQLGIKDGTCFQIDVDTATRQIILTPITPEYIHRLRGKYKGKGLMKALMAEKKRERDL